MSADPVKALIDAEAKAQHLFETIEERGLISPGKMEKELNKEVFELAFELFGIRKYWHKRIVRAGKNTLLPYRHNPPDLIIRDDDILFFDFGPVFEDWEADVGKTYVLGGDDRKKKLAADVESAWHRGKEWFDEHHGEVTGSDFYAFTKELAESYGWTYGNEHCGHLIGNFPHEKIQGEEVTNYIHPDNNVLMSDPDSEGRPRYWIYEIHFIDEENEIGGFFEQLLTR